MSLPKVVLRPLTDNDTALRDRLRSPEAAGEYNTFEIPEKERKTALDHGGGERVVETAGGTAVGSVSWRAVIYGPGRRNVAWRIGITILPEHRRLGYGAAAQQGLAGHLFATTDANRVEADCDVTNLAEQRALERAGFTRESVMKSAQFREGDYHDLVLYRVVRHEFDNR